MNLLPFEKYVIRTNMSLEDLHLSIDQSCAPFKFLNVSGSLNKPLFGKRTENNFKLYRAIRYRNSFLPIAFGQITDNGNEVLVEITLKMNLAVMIFMAFWMSIASVSELALVLSGTEELSFSSLWLLGPGYLLMQAGFWFEVPKLKKIIRNVVPERN